MTNDRKELYELVGHKPQSYSYSYYPESIIYLPAGSKIFTEFRITHGSLYFEFCEEINGSWINVTRTMRGSLYHSGFSGYIETFVAPLADVMSWGPTEINGWFRVRVFAKTPDCVLSLKISLEEPERQHMCVRCGTQPARKMRSDDGSFEGTVHCPGCFAVAFSEWRASQVAKQLQAPTSCAGCGRPLDPSSDKIDNFGRCSDCGFHDEWEGREAGLAALRPDPVDLAGERYLDALRDWLDPCLGKQNWRR